MLVITLNFSEPAVGEGHHLCLYICHFPPPAFADNCSLVALAVSPRSYQAQAFLGKDFCLETLPLIRLLMHTFHELQRVI